MSLLLDAPNLGEREKEMLLQCVDSTYVSTAGPFVPEFEERFARYLGAPAAVAVQSGTAALHIALAELGLKPGDEVIVFDPYFVMYTALPEVVGGKAVLIDTYPDFRIDLDRVRAAITARTKMIIFNSPANPTGVVGGEGQQLRVEPDGLAHALEQGMPITAALRVPDLPDKM